MKRLFTGRCESDAPLHARPILRIQQTGFTLFEVMVAVTITLVFVGLAFVSLGGISVEQGARASKELISSAVRTAQSHAIERREPIAVLASGVIRNDSQQWSLEIRAIEPEDDSDERSRGDAGQVDREENQSIDGQLLDLIELPQAAVFLTDGDSTDTYLPSGVASERDPLPGLTERVDLANEPFASLVLAIALPDGSLLHSPNESWVLEAAGVRLMPQWNMLNRGFSWREDKTQDERTALDVSRTRDGESSGEPG